jgi:hypothetical protein
VFRPDLILEEEHVLPGEPTRNITAAAKQRGREAKVGLEAQLADPPSAFAHKWFGRQIRKGWEWLTGEPRFEEFVESKLLPPMGPPQAECPPGSFLSRGQCVAPGDIFPGGDPFMQTAGGQAVQGGFGLPAVTPTVFQQPIRRCPRGFVLGLDNLCYPKAILPRRSKLRKHRPPPRPAVTGGDVAAIRRADATRKRLVKLTKAAGAHASLRPHRSRHRSSHK